MSSPVAAHPLGGPAAWRGPQMAATDSWVIELLPEHVSALVDAAQQLPAGGFHRDDAATLDLPLPGVQPLAAHVRRELVDGRGFVLLRGIPVGELGKDLAERAYWVLGLHVGIPVPQGTGGDLVMHVKDQGLDYTDPHVRGYQTSARLDYHVDGSDVVGLLCLHPAKQGGASTIVSSVAIHDEVLRRRPDLAQVLAEPFWFDRRNGDGPESFYQLPVFGWEDDRFVAYYGRSYIESAQRGPQTSALTAEQLEALDLVDELANSPEMFLAMDFRPGDIQFINNRTILHARTQYENWPEPERHRDLARLWLSLGDGRHAEMVPAEQVRAAR